MKAFTIAVGALVALAGTAAATQTTATGIEEPSATPTLNAPTVQGCFSSEGELQLQNSSEVYNSKGKCATEYCYAMGKAVAGTTGGSKCYCGDKYPPADTLTEDKNCNVYCPGWPYDACGGVKFWTIYNTGLTLDVSNSDDDTSSASSSTTTAPTGAIVTVSGTVVVTQTPTETSSNSGGGSNTAGIAAGVVVGVVAVAAIIGGVLFYLRRKRNREIEEEHRRNAAVSAFIHGKPGSSSGTSITDARLDPVMAQRRMSDGSIADNQDYSRRILRVTNA